MNKDLKENIKESLTSQFTEVLKGVSLDVIQAKLKTETEGEEAGEQLFAEHTGTIQEKIWMDKVLKKLEDGLRDPAANIVSPKDRTILVTEIGSLPETQNEIRDMIGKAFKAVPLDYLDRPLLEFIIYYTEGDKDRIEGIQKYLKELRAKGSRESSLIKLKSKTEAALTSAFKSHKNRQKPDDNLLFVVPDLKATIHVRGANVMLLKDSAIPKNLARIKGILSQVAVRLAKEMKRPENDPGRIKFLEDLQESLDITVSKNTENQQFVISFNLLELVQKLVALQKQEARLSAAA